MSPDDLRAIMEFLRERVRLADQGSVGEVTIAFDAPSVDEMADAGLDPEGSSQVLAAAWWDEMVTDIVETPEMCDEDDSPEEALGYAKDVVSEYIRKRAEL